MKARGSAHTPWAFSLADAAQLPLTGEVHPLRREIGKWLLWANIVVVALGIVFFTSWRLWNRAREREPVARQVKIVRYAELGVPPSISRQAVRPVVPKVDIARAVAPPSIGVPEPVPDEEAPAQTIATVEEMQEALEPITLEDLGGGEGDSIVIDALPRSPGPDEFVVVDEEPVRIRIDAPVYPDLARDADVEGTVIVRALVGTDGKIKDAIVIDGHPMLNEAALTCARTAIFRPALAQNEPVEVWVMIPVTFQLH